MRRTARIAMCLGVAVAVLGLSKVHARYIAPAPYVWHTSFRFAWSFAYIGLQCLVAYGVGLPDLARGKRAVVFSAVAAACGGAFAISVVQLLVGDALLPRFVVFGTVLLLIPWHIACAALASGGRRTAGERDRVLLVGTPSDEERLRADLARDVERPAVLVGSISVDEARSTAPRSKPLTEAAVAARASVVVLAGPSREDESVVAQVASLHEGGVRVRTLSLFYEQWLGKLPVTELERVSLMFDVGEVHRARYARLKRMVDVPLAIVGCLVLLLAVPVVAVANFFGNRGPLLFRQQRVGKDGRTFAILKFRTMRDIAGEAGTWTERDDPRVTPVGRVLRTTHLDELPQVVNILRGELAVVGPRPEQPRYVEELREKLPFYDLRHLVHPGLTGWAQVKYGYAGDEGDALEKLQYEFFYLRHQGLALDLRVIGRTVRSVMGGRGR
jgi:lipopolysaccharide/colanic/teichoic acid biosynthesis glycosyltransferase